MNKMELAKKLAEAKMEAYGFDPLREPNVLSHVYVKALTKTVDEIEEELRLLGVETYEHF